MENISKYEELLKSNFHKVVEYIKATYPHAIERSYTKTIKCDAPHHVYYTCYIELKDGKVLYRTGSHGWDSHDDIYDDETQTWNHSYNKEYYLHRLERFLNEWGAQKAYIHMTLAPYESQYNFEI